MATGVYRKKKQETVQNAKIDSYFKPAPKPNMSNKLSSPIKRQLENDENSSYNDENKKKPLAPSNSQAMKRQFGEIKGAPFKSKDNQSLFRLPLRDKNPKTPTSISDNSKPINPKRKKIAPGFAVLCDDDIEKGIEKAPTPPMRDSQESSQADSQEGPFQHEFNTQSIHDISDSNTQWSEATSSPIDFYREDDTESQSLLVFQDEGSNHGSAVLEEHENKKTEASVRNKAGKENQIDSSDENSQALATNLPRSISSQNSDKDDDEEDDSNVNDDDDDDDDDDEDSDLFAKTVDTSIKFKHVPLARSNTAVEDGFFSDNDQNEEEEESTTFFDLESDNDGLDTDTKFIEEGLEFSVGQLETAPAEENLQESLRSYTLSPTEVDSLSQVHMPLPNPRGDGILEKLGIENKIVDDKNKDDQDSVTVS